MTVLTHAPDMLPIIKAPAKPAASELQAVGSAK